jgi:hypothetical protein
MELPQNVLCPKVAPGTAGHVVVIEGSRYYLTTFDAAAPRGPHRVKLNEMDPKGPPRSWAISVPLPSTSRNKYASLRTPFALEFPDQATRDEARRLVALLIEQGDLARPAGLQPHC